MTKRLRLESTDGKRTAARENSRKRVARVLWSSGRREFTNNNEHLDETDAE